MLVTTGVAVHLVPIMVWKGLGEAGAAYMVSVIALGTIATSLLFGWLANRFSPAFLSGVGALLGSAGVACLVALPLPWGVYLFLLLFTIAEGSILLNWVMIGTFFGRGSFGTLRGVMGPPHSVLTFASPIFAGWVYDRTESYAGALITLCILIGLSGLMFFLLRQPRPPRPTSLRPSSES
jgi:MFS family permease